MLIKVLMPVVTSLMIIALCNHPTNPKMQEIKNKQITQLNQDSFPVYDFSELLNNRDYLMGKIFYASYRDFIKLPGNYASQENTYLRKDAAEQFMKMSDDAAKEGIKLVVVSGARNFEKQKTIWEAKWNGERLVEGKNLATEIKDPNERARMILLYSSMPSTSRHHWGTDMDINALEDDYFLKGQGKKEYDWLVENGPKYGFCQVYSKKGKDRPFGYEEEKWHWSYMPVSRILLENYLKNVKLSDIKDFKGSETSSKLDVINRYVGGISPVCK